MASDAFMKAHTEYLTFNTRKRKEMVHITEQIEAIVRRSGIRDGLALVFFEAKYLNFKSKL